MSSPALSTLLNSLFNLARAKYSIESRAWVDLSYRLSGRFNLPAALTSIQREGDLDILLRGLEDEFTRNKNASGLDLSAHYQMMFSETWIVGFYEILRAFRQRDREADEPGSTTSGVSVLAEFKTVFSDFEILRMPLAKFELAKDYKLEQPLPMQRVGVGDTKPMFYNPKDPRRFHIMPKGMSPRGSAMWLAIDLRTSQQHWLERRDLADRLLSLLKVVKGAGELEAEPSAARQPLK